jgi:hypothetical protein
VYGIAEEVLEILNELASIEETESTFLLKAQVDFGLAVEAESKVWRARYSPTCLGCFEEAEKYKYLFLHKILSLLSAHNGRVSLDHLTDDVSSGHRILTIL